MLWRHHDAVTNEKRVSVNLKKKPEKKRSSGK